MWTLSSFANTQLLELLNRHGFFGAEFNKTVVNKRGAIVELTDGSINLVRPNLLHWVENNGVTIVANSDKVYVYRPLLNQVQIQSLDSALSNTPAGLLLTPSKRLLKDYSVTVNNYDNESEFNLIPKKLEGFVRNFRLVFVDERLIKFSLTDWQYNTILLTFANNIQKPPNKDLFDFNLTPDMEVIR